MNDPKRRLPRGGRIDRARPVEFTFDGRAYSGFAGDTLASALLANGVTLIGRSFKYHRPRGIYSAGPEEPNALVTLGARGRREPNAPATTVELIDDLRAESQNRWPSLRFDLQAVNSLLAPFLPAGFYYKTFMGPTKRAWMFYEHFIRRAAGLGRATEEPDADCYGTRHEFCDVAIIGAGPAGLGAALAAGRSGARVMLIEQDFVAGGALLVQPTDGPAAKWLADALAELDSLSNVSVLTRATAFGLYDGGTLGLVERHDPWTPAAGRVRQSLVMVRSRSMVFATGAIQRPLVFANNDRPGVMLAYAARAYLNRFGVLAGRRIVVVTNNDEAYRAAFDLADAGADVTVADTRSGQSRTLLESARRRHVEVWPATVLLGARGRHAVSAVYVGSSGGGKRETVACDLLCVSGGWSPSVHLTSHLGDKPRYHEGVGAFVPGRLPPGHFVAGALIGSFGTKNAVTDGATAGRSAAEYCGFQARTGPIDAPEIDWDFAAAPAPQKISSVRGKAFVDVQNDVTVADIRLAHREGYESLEHLKRYTTLGMGTDQGKTSNLNAIALAAELRGIAAASAGTTTFRPPYTPVTIGALAGRSVGRHFRPVRLTPMHDWHLAHSAQMIEVGLWMRPWFYRSSGATVDTAYVEEMRFVRDSAGIVDISTLGKIDIQGPDAARFLDRVYVNNWSRLPAGRARYGAMLRDDGIVLDDGTTTRLGDQRYFMTTSTAKAADVMSWLEFLLQTAWFDLRVQVTSVTDDWAAMSVAGPRSRDVLAAAFPSFDFTDTALPHMGAMEGVFEGKPIRFLRLSYSGERAYEVYVGASHGRAVWELIFAKGHQFGLRAYGVEALGALRVEKGHVAGPEIDGRTTLADLGLDRLASRTKPFVGRVLSGRPALLDEGRPRLVGLECVDPGSRLRPGAILFAKEEPVQGHGRGRVTSTTFSPILNKWIGLGFYSGGMAHEGEEIVVDHPIKGERVRARIVPPVFLDPAGDRLRG